MSEQRLTPNLKDTEGPVIDFPRFPCRWSMAVTPGSSQWVSGIVIPAKGQGDVSPGHGCSTVVSASELLWDISLGIISLCLVSVLSPVFPRMLCPNQPIPFLSYLAEVSFCHLQLWILTDSPWVNHFTLLGLGFLSCERRWGKGTKCCLRYFLKLSGCIKTARLVGSFEGWWQ